MCYYAPRLKPSFKMHTLSPIPFKTCNFHIILTGMMLTFQTVGKLNAIILPVVFCKALPSAYQETNKRKPGPPSAVLKKMRHSTKKFLATRFFSQIYCGWYYGSIYYALTSCHSYNHHTSVIITIFIDTDPYSIPK